MITGLGLTRIKCVQERMLGRLVGMASADVVVMIHPGEEALVTDASIEAAIQVC
jgi:hypothetical protein